MQNRTWAVLGPVGNLEKYGKCPGSLGEECWAEQRAKHGYVVLDFDSLTSFLWNWNLSVMSKKIRKCFLSRRQRRTIYVLVELEREKPKSRCGTMPTTCSQRQGRLLLEEPTSILERLSPLRFSSVKYEISKIKKCLFKDYRKEIEYLAGRWWHMLGSQLISGALFWSC